MSSLPPDLRLEWAQSCVRSGNYLDSRHRGRGRRAAGLSLMEAEEALLGGRDLEHYADTGRGPSCLVAGFTEAGKPIHAVCGRMGLRMFMVTVYIPTPPKFKNPFERG